MLSRHSDQDAMHKANTLPLFGQMLLLKKFKMHAFMTSLEVEHHVHVGHSTSKLPSLRLSFRNGLGWDEDVGVVRHGQTLQVFSNKYVKKIGKTKLD